MAYNNEKSHYEVRIESISKESVVWGFSIVINMEFLKVEYLNFILSLKDISVIVR